MRRQHVDLQVPGHDHSLSLIAYGHYGRPVLVFPSEAGRAWDFENNGMIGAIEDLIGAGRAKVYCVDSLDAYSWSDSSIPVEERAIRHGLYTQWLVEEAIPWIRRDTADGAEVMALGCSLGAYHAVHLALQRADLVPLAIGFSGNYDVATWKAWGDRGDATYFANPTDYVANLHGDHLDWLRNRLSILLICGQGAWEGSSKTRESAASSICGVMTSATTGPGGGARSPTICPDSADRVAKPKRGDR
jgi:esterase/lipase superfamily enzyme